MQVSISRKIFLFYLFIEDYFIYNKFFMDFVKYFILFIYIYIYIFLN